MPFDPNVFLPFLSSTLSFVVAAMVACCQPLPAPAEPPTILLMVDDLPLDLDMAPVADTPGAYRVTHNAFKGEDLNHYVPIFRQYGIPVLYNFKDEDMRWIRYTPKARLRALDHIFPEGIHIPDYFFGKNIVIRPGVPADKQAITIHHSGMVGSDQSGWSGSCAALWNGALPHVPW